MLVVTGEEWSMSTWTVARSTTASNSRGVKKLANLERVLDNLDPAVNVGFFSDVFHLPTNRFP